MLSEAVRAVKCLGDQGDSGRWQTPKGTTKRRPQTLARLLDAAREVFAESGVQGSRIEDICRRAGYTRGAFYSNFRTKDELFFALFDAHADRELARITKAAAAFCDDELTVGRIAEVLAYIDRDLFERAGLRPTVNLDELVRVVIAMREGALGQSYVEPDRLTPGALAGRFLPLLLAASTAELKGPPPRLQSAPPP